MKTPKPPKPKQISFSLIPPMDNGHEPEVYRLLREVRDKWHPDLVNWDFVILLNRDAFQDTAFTLEKRIALIDHELCHATRALDRFYAPANDEKGRAVWRMRKHDIEEFRCIVQRHGCYKKDLEAFAEVLLKHAGNLVFPTMDETKPPNGETIAAKPETESSTEERTRQRLKKIKKTGIDVKVKLLGQDAVLGPDRRTSFPHGANEPGAPNAN